MKLFSFFKKRENKQFPKPTLFDWALGMHGYDNYNPHMFGIFLAYGSAFKSGYHKTAAGLIDVHPLICNLLNISCPRQTDADFSHIKDILVANSVQNQAELLKRNFFLLFFLYFFCSFFLF